MKKGLTSLYIFATMLALLLLLNATPANMLSILSYQYEYPLDTSTYNVSLIFNQYSEYTIHYGSAAYSSYYDRFLVSWVRIASEKYRTGYIYASIINPSTGTPEATFTLNSLTDNRAPGAVIAGSNTFLVAYYYWGGSTNKYDVAVSIVKQSGGSWVSNEIVVANEPNVHEEYVVAAYTGGKYLVVLYNSSDKALYGVLIDEPTESIVGGGKLVDLGSTYKNAQFGVIGGDNNYLVVYKYFDGSQDDIKAALVDTSGSLVKTYTITATPDYNETLYGVKGGAFLDGKYYFIYNKPTATSNELHLVIIDTVTDTYTDQLLVSDGMYPCITAGNTTVLVAWRELGLGNGTIKAAIVHSNGSYVVYDLSEDDTDIYHEGYVWASWSPSKNYYVVIWQRGIGSERGVYGRSISEEGYLSPLVEIVTKTGEQIVPKGVAVDNNGYAVIAGKYIKSGGADSDTYSWSILLDTDLPAPIFEPHYILAVITVTVLLATVTIIRKLLR